MNAIIKSIEIKEIIKAKRIYYANRYEACIDIKLNYDLPEKVRDNLIEKKIIKDDFFELYLKVDSYENTALKLKRLQRQMIFIKKGDENILQISYIFSNSEDMQMFAKVFK